MTKFDFHCIHPQAFFCDYFKDNAAIQQIDWDTWYYAPGARCACCACCACWSPSRLLFLTGMVPCWP